MSIWRKPVHLWKLLTLLLLVLFAVTGSISAQVDWVDWPSPDEDRPAYTIRPDHKALLAYDSPEFDKYLGETQQVEIYQPEHHVYRVPFRYNNVQVDGWLEYNDKGIELLADVGSITIVEEKPIVSVTIVGSGCCTPNYNIVEWWGEGENMRTVRGQLPKRARIDNLKGIHVAWQQEAFTKKQEFENVEQANRFIADLQKIVYAQTSGYYRHGSVLPGMHENTAYFRVGDVNVFGQPVVAPGPNIRPIIDRQEVHKIVVKGGGMDYENPGCEWKGRSRARHPADYAIRLVDVVVKN